jgi:alpha-tubulin suppressor-like RCC1 family protein
MNSTALSPTSPSWFKTKVSSLFGLILFSFLLVGCGSSGGGGSSNTNTSKEDNNSNTTPPSSSKELTSFWFDSGVIKNATINGTEVNITIDYYSNHTTPIVTHTGKDYSPKGAINFMTMPKTYNITAEDDTIKSYNVTVRRAFIVSNETELVNVIDNITDELANNSKISYITILITNDINLTWANQRVISSTWVGKHITIEKHNTTLPNNVTINGFAIQGDDTVGLIDVNVDGVVSPIIAAGLSHSLTLDSKNKLWVSGRNGAGQLGLGNNSDQTSFQSAMIQGLTSGEKITSVAAGTTHSFVVTSDGKLWAAGWNYYGQLGLDNTSIQNLFQLVTILGLTSGVKIVSIAAGDLYSLALDSNGQIWATRNNSFQPVTISALSLNANIVSIKTGVYHSLALDSNGQIWAMGQNDDGQLGLGSTNSQSSFQPVTIASLAPTAKIVSIAAGYEHSLALDSDGKLWATGSNFVGELGFGNPDWGTHESLFKSVTISGLPLGAKIISIAAGDLYSLALDSNGKLWATGWNHRGQLGLGNTTNQSKFQPVTISGLTSGARIVYIAAGGDHAFALTSDGKLWATGYNEYGQLGLGDNINRNVFTQVLSF